MENEKKALKVLKKETGKLMAQCTKAYAFDALSVEEDYDPQEETTKMLSSCVAMMTAYFDLIEEFQAQLDAIEKKVDKVIKVKE